ncbi:MAG: tRNA threonylcarbamoyladenosine dehydratase [Bacteroidaceae bacterium]|nr:tRNA threonylcarbamoyladenosine dehydratase [Bacteroidaceae bacterium]
MQNNNDFLSRTELLLGEDVMDRIATARVIVFGVGGVGSWCAESLVRTGIRHLTIVDFDTICPSNINRQLMATHTTVGQQKVEVLKQRLLSINPTADINAISEAFNCETAEKFHLESYDYVIDAIDSLSDKVLLIDLTCRTSAHLFSSMGAALKIDPSHIRVSEFWKVQGDPLARALRNKFKKLNQFPKRKFMCVYSDEVVKRREPATNKVNGTIAHITAIFGFTLASLVIQNIYNQNP